MHRDTIKDAKYFDDYIDCQKKRIEKFAAVSEALDSSETKKVAQCNRYLANYYKDMISAEYSAGEPKDSIKKTYDDYISCVKACGVCDYAEFIDMLSLAVLFQVDYETVKELVRVEWSDSLTEILCEYLGKERDQATESKLLYTDYYTPFYQYATGKSDLVDFSTYISNEWYDSNKDMYWYDSHKKKEDVYAGYWCWLAAALMKIRNAPSEIVKYVPLELI
ncbi:MAG: DUF1910 domain-containing protein [Clostridiales bacterium]|nr:DUF1910 domain-containing protein [Clostridiales bacterium]